MGDVIFGILVGLVLGIVGGIIFGMWAAHDDINNGHTLLQNCIEVVALRINDGVPEYPQLYYCSVYDE